jgi:probable F420-dependent oxidoreductase
MRFSYAETMTDPAYYLPLAQAAEEAGYDAMTVPDSICYPQESDSTYPYTPDGNREFLEDKPFIEPFSLIPAMGAVTSKIRFDTFVLKLPIRHPVLVAKQAASVAVLTDNRLGLGVGTSPWPDDYEVTGVPWEGRGRRMDEAMEIVRGLTNGGYFELHGEAYDVPAIKISPVPSAPIPLLIGGHGDAALRRAARLADGWMHAGSEMDDLPRFISRLAELRREYGKEGPYEIHVISLDAYSVDGVRRLEDEGVTNVIVGFRLPYTREQDTEPLQTKIDALRRYADDVITPSRG